MKKEFKSNEECKAACEAFILEKHGAPIEDYSFISSESGKCYVEYDDVWYDLSNNNAVILDK